MLKEQKATVLTPRQSAYMQAYYNRESPTFGNSYQSARAAGYSSQFARNLTHLNPDWLSTNIGQTDILQPDELIKELAVIIHDPDEPSIVKLRAIELNLKAYGMLAQRREPAPQVVTLNIDLTGAAPLPA